MEEKMEKVLLDTTVLIKAICQEKNYQAVAEYLIKIEEGKIIGVISCVTFTEMLYILNRKKNEKFAYECVVELENSRMEMFEITNHISKKAGALKIKYLDKNISIADALIIATAIENDVDLVLTSDKAWAEIPEINCKIA